MVNREAPEAVQIRQAVYLPTGNTGFWILNWGSSKEPRKCYVEIWLGELCGIKRRLSRTCKSDPNRNGTIGTWCCPKHGSESGSSISFRSIVWMRLLNLLNEIGQFSARTQTSSHGNKPNMAARKHDQQHDRTCMELAYTFHMDVPGWDEKSLYLERSGRGRSLCQRRVQRDMF
jgi:hypothetical protein